MILCIGSYFAMWLCYLLWMLKQPLFSAKTLSAVSLGAIIVLVSMVVLMTLAILCPPARSRSSTRGYFRRVFSRLIRWAMLILHNLRMGASQEPFLALLLFFTAFLGISYLFGFTFAFHDKSLAPAEHGLYMRKPYMPAPVTSSSPSAYQNFRFEFDSSQAIPDVEENPPELQSAETDLKKIAERKSNNHKNLEGIVAYLGTIPPADALRIFVIGHADDVPTQGAAYLSNYELSQARAENVRHKILARLNERGDNTWRNIEWLCLSKSNEGEASRLAELVNNPSDKKTRQRGPAKPLTTVLANERFVEVQINRQLSQATSVQLEHLSSDGPQDLQLIDYIYFANYTITTTGYGDIIPLTPFSKFVCSLANICEVFFLVVFFNALLSVKGVISSFSS
jgi:hypothetical protein